MTDKVKKEEKRGRCFIFGALEAGYYPESPAKGDYIIAADRGYANAAALGLRPDMVVGDFDSLGSPPEHDNIVRLQVRKDDTDMEHAAVAALDMGFTDFVIYGAVGGKLDHTMGNIAVAQMIADRGGRAVFYGDDSSFTVVRNSSFAFAPRVGGRVSVISLSDVSRGVSVRGLSYEADGVDLPRASTLGVSNEFVGKSAEISAVDGTLLIIWDSVN